jgi:hypothetical protein
MVGIEMAQLKYLSFDIFLRYFDHSNRIPCVSMDSYRKNHVKQAIFHMDYALYRLDMVGIVMAHLKYLSFDNFVRYFDHSNRIPCVSMDPFSKNHGETGNFHMDYALYRLG